jgi:hypothetical protein
MKTYRSTVNVSQISGMHPLPQSRSLCRHDQKPREPRDMSRQRAVISPRILFSLLHRTGQLFGTSFSDTYFSIVSAIMASSEVVSEVIVRPQKTTKRFECPRCQRQFSRLEHLQRHERTRKSVLPSPLALSPCFSCRHIHDTRSHREVNHIDICRQDTQERPFACLQCESRFTRRYELSSLYHKLDYVLTGLSGAAMQRSVDPP